MMMVMTMTVMMTMCFLLPLQRLADSRGSALGAFVRTHYTGNCERSTAGERKALVRTHYTGCCGLRSTAGERKCAGTGKRHT